MAMTRKDYQLIVDTISKMAKSNGEMFEFAGIFASELEGSYPNFDRTKFLLACEEYMIE